MPKYKSVRSETVMKVYAYLKEKEIATIKELRDNLKLHAYKLDIVLEQLKELGLIEFGEILYVGERIMPKNSMFNGKTNNFTRTMKTIKVVKKELSK